MGAPVPRVLRDPWLVLVGPLASRSANHIICVIYLFWSYKIDFYIFIVKMHLFPYRFINMI